jgi:hypothetical protein
MASYVASRGFALVTLGWVVACAGLISFFPQQGGWLIGAALLPFAPRLLAPRPLAGRFPFVLTPFDFFFIVFLVTAGVGVWAAYNPVTAWAKFWTLAGAILIFYALALQPGENLHTVALGLCGLSALAAIHFLLAVNWEAQPSDFGPIRRLGDAWVAVRPALGLDPVNTNVAGGVLALLLPFNLAVILRAWQARLWSELGWAAVTGLIAAFGLLLTSSRAAWLGLLAGLAVWALWGACVFLAPKIKRSANQVFLALMGAGAAVIVIGVLVYPGGLAALGDRLPGLQSGYSRVALWGQAITLARDYPLTGGGLESFAGIYSRYELVIPYKLFEYAHNFPLDVWFEQGLAGALALAVIVTGSVWLLARGADDEWRWPIAAAFVAVALHGLVDDALYSGAAAPWLFLLPGLSVLRNGQSASRRPWLTAQLASLAAVAAIGLAFALIPAWRAAALANVGAVEMARLELNGWPVRNWQDNGDPRALASARAWFEQALSTDAHNPTAAFRLGLIEAMEDDHARAVMHMEAARGVGATPHGLAKSLGYSYTWLGQIEAGAALLRTVPEARYEMQLYAEWWLAQGHADRAEFAAQMDARLAELGLPVVNGPLERLP